MTYRHQSTPQPTSNADVLAAFADWLAANPGVRPVITAAEFEVDGYDAQDADMLALSDGEATHLERALGIAS